MSAGRASLKLTEKWFARVDQHLRQPGLQNALLEMIHAVAQGEKIGLRELIRGTENFHRVIGRLHLLFIEQGGWRLDPVSAMESVAQLSRELAHCLHIQHMESFIKSVTQAGGFQNALNELYFVVRNAGVIKMVQERMTQTGRIADILTNDGRRIELKVYDWTREFWQGRRWRDGKLVDDKSGLRLAAKGDAEQLVAFREGGAKVELRILDADLPGAQLYLDALREALRKQLSHLPSERVEAEIAEMISGLHDMLARPPG